jgi:hypothetical protein
MKKLLGLSLALTVAIFICSGVAQASVLGIGDTIQIDWGMGSIGGEYNVYSSSNPSTFLFTSFCADESIPMSASGSTYTIASINTTVPDGAAYLYFHFIKNNLASGYSNLDIIDPDALQLAIYAFMSGTVDIYSPDYGVTRFGKYIEEAINNTAGSPNNVVIFNLEHSGNAAQPIFAYVPEPGFLLLLAAGLLTLVVVVLRKI